MTITKKELLKAVEEDTATFVSEHHVCKDCWHQEYKYKDVSFIVNVYTYDKWLEEDPELIYILED